jgi:N-acetylmuramoyl-L-alanine amidase
MTRKTDTTVSLAARANLANRANADYFCSIHVNAGGGTGWESYIFNGRVPERTINAQQTIHNDVMSRIRPHGVRDRGMKRANFFVLRETNMSAMLLENLFLDNRTDLNLLRNKTFLGTLARATGDGLARALNLPRVNVTLHIVIAGSFTSQANAEQRRDFLNSRGVEAIVVPTAIDGTTWYRVQAGAFRNRHLAEARLDVIRNLGIDGFIITR